MVENFKAQSAEADQVPSSKTQAPAVGIPAGKLKIQSFIFIFLTINLTKKVLLYLPCNIMQNNIASFFTTFE